jgi:hypothetical protein
VEANCPEGHFAPAVAAVFRATHRKSAGARIASPTDMRAVDLGLVVSSGALLLTLSGCFSVKGMPIGRQTPPNPPGCPVRFEYLSPKLAEERYEQVGVICYATWGSSRAAPTSDLLNPYIRAEVCRLGGEVIVRRGFCNWFHGRSGDIGTELGVYASR